MPSWPITLRYIRTDAARRFVSRSLSDTLCTPLPRVSLGAAVREGRELLPKAIEVVEVEGGERIPVAVRTLGQHRAPRVDDDGPSIGPASVGLLSPLGRGDDIGLVLHGPRPQEELPVVLTRLEREGGRDSEDPGAAQRQQ